MKQFITDKLSAVEKENDIKILFACESGSRGWGFPSPDSDYDVRFIYVRPYRYYLSVMERADDLNFAISGDLDMYGWDLRKVLQLMRKSNVTRELANEVSLSSIPKGEKEKAYLFFNLESYSSYCKDYKEYWEWVEKRNEHRYLGNVEHGKGYDAKNMMHTIRLLQVAEEILTQGRLNVKRFNRDELLSIKAGDRPYDDLLEMADSLMTRIEAAYFNSPLPEVPDKEKAELVLIQMRETLYG